MKKLITFIILGISILTASARTLYLVPGVWDIHGAKFAMYYFNMDGNSGWSQYMSLQGDAYVGEIPDNYEWVIFVRLNPAGDINWESKWNQTEDLPIVLDCYTVLGWGEENQPSPGEWSAVYIDKYKYGNLYYNINSITKTAEVTSEHSSWPYWSSTIDVADIPSEVIYYDEEAYSVTSIGMYAFYECKRLTSVSIPNSVTSIAGEAFERCTWMSSINVASNNPNYSSLDGILFNKDRTTLYFYPRGKSGHYSVPNNVIYIGERAFEECLSLQSITIPNNVQGVGPNAFKGCYGLPEIDGIIYADTYLVEATNKDLSTYVIKDGTRWIGNDAFSNCQNMREVTIPNSVFSIGARAFDRCFKLRSVTNYAASPQPILENVFWALDKSKCTLYVPAESINAYKAAEQWKEFNPIQAIQDSEGIDDIIGDKTKRAKFIRDGQILILRGGKTYTLQGQEVK